jgi:hypothetical protein
MPSWCAMPCSLTSTRTLSFFAACVAARRCGAVARGVVAAVFSGPRRCGPRAGGDPGRHRRERNGDSPPPQRQRRGHNNRATVVAGQGPPRAVCRTSFPRSSSLDGRNVYALHPAVQSAALGLCLLAGRAVPKDTLVTRYTGEEIDNDEATRRRRLHKPDGDAYFFRVPGTGRGGSGHRRHIDARRLGGVARFANHACRDRNAEFVPVGREVWIRALRDVDAGEFLTVWARVLIKVIACDFIYYRACLRVMSLGYVVSSQHSDWSGSSPHSSLRSFLLYFSTLST